MSGKVVDFKAWVSSQALGEKIPFEVLGTIPKRWANVEKEEIACMQFPVLNTLLTREVWFREFIGTSLGNKKVELQVGIYTLAKKLRDFAPGIISTDTKAVHELSMLLNGQQAKEEDEAVQAEKDEMLNSFFMSHLADFQGLLNLIQSMSDNTMNEMLQVTFFIASRVDASWGFGDTSTLLPDELQAIKAFMVREMNGGVVQAEEPVQAEEEEQSLGEESAA